MKTLVAYYSKTGSNRFLAKKIREDLECDIEELKPRVNLLFFTILSSLTKISLGNKKVEKSPADYDRVILVTPIWMGKLIVPAYNFLKKYNKEIKELNFLTCCGGDDDSKDDKFGYNSVFNQVKDIVGTRCKNCDAISVTLAVPEDKRDDDEAVMNARINSESFKGELLERYNLFLDKL